MALSSGAVERLRGFRSPDALLRTLLLHVARGYSLRETTVQAKLANWADVSDVALLKRLRNSEGWLRSLCIGLLRENGIPGLEGAMLSPTRIIDGTIVREPGKTGSQWRILYSLRLPSLVCDFFDLTAASGEGNGESLNRLPVGRHEFILADAGYCSIAGIEYVHQRGADLLVRVNPQSSSLIRRTANGLPSRPDCEGCCGEDRSGNGESFCTVRTPRSLGGCAQCGRAITQSSRLIGVCSARRARSK